jgi:hypothetical protein
MSHKKFPLSAEVIKAYTRSSENPMIARSGALLTPIRRDPDWPGWVFCVDENGVEAWVPEEWLITEKQQTRLIKDYNSIELTLQLGEHLVLHAEESGWYWASRANGETGWVPANCVDIIT